MRTGHGRIMKSVVIHAGYYLPADIPLQQKLFKQLRINYLYLAGAQSRILDRIESHAAFDPDALKRWAANKIRRCYPGKAKRLAVLSHEKLSGYSYGRDTADALRYAYHLKESFPNAKILFFIRDQRDYLLSLYSARVIRQGDETRRFEQFLTEDGGKGLFRHLEYHHLVNHYQNLFGRARVLVLPVELWAISPELFVKRLCGFLEVPCSLVAVKEIVNSTAKSVSILRGWRRINTLFRGMLRVLAVILRKQSGPAAWRRLGALYCRVKRKATKNLVKMRFFKKPLEITRDSPCGHWLDRCKASNRDLQKIIADDLAALGYPVDGKGEGDASHAVTSPEDHALETASSPVSYDPDDLNERFAMEFALTEDRYRSEKHQCRRIHIMMDAVKGPKVLEVGAGDGYCSLVLIERGFDVTSTEISKIRLERMKKAGLKPVEAPKNNSRPRPRPPILSAP